MLAFLRISLHILRLDPHALFGFNNQYKVQQNNILQNPSSSQGGLFEGKVREVIYRDASNDVRIRMERSDIQSMVEQAAFANMDFGIILQDQDFRRILS